MLSRLQSFLSALISRSRLESEMRHEIRDHMERYARDLVSSGVSIEEAERRARIEFGSVPTIEDECREALGLRLVDQLRRNVRYAFRMWTRNPLSTAAIVLTLALCICANTALFSVVDAVVLRPLPYPEPDRLAQIVIDIKNGSSGGLLVSQTGEIWEAVRDHASNLDAAVFYNGSSGVNFVSGDQAEFLEGQRISAGFFRVLGVPPVLGRGFTETEDVVGGPRVVVLSYSLWNRVFNRDAAIVGGRITLRGEPYTVVGVMPEGFRTTAEADVWTPLRPSTSGEGQGSNYAVIGRLRDDVTWSQADAQIGIVGGPVVDNYRMPEGAEAELRLVPLQRGLTEFVREPLFILWGAAGVVLLMGCVNIASLLLARERGRVQEVATRIALGSGRSGVIGQMLTESAVLGAAGGLAGIGSGYLGIDLFNRLAPGNIGIWQTVQLDMRVLAATLFLSLLTSVLFGLFPAVQASRIDVNTGLTSAGGRGFAGSRSRWPQRLLVVGQIAMSFVLLVGAGLLIRTFDQLSRIEPGFEASNLVTAKISLQDARYEDSTAVARLFDEGLRRIRLLSGIEAAAVGLCLPYERPLNAGFVRLDGPDVDGEPKFSNVCYATPGYFRALGVPVEQGRNFDEADSAGSAPVALVNRSFVREYLTTQEPLESHIAVFGAERTIVGIVGDVLYTAGFGNYGPIDSPPAIYIPVAQTSAGTFITAHTWFAPSWIVRTSRSPEAVVAGMQEAVRSIDPLLPFSSFRTMDDVRYSSLANQRFRATLLEIMAAIALTLAAIGVYGLIANSIVERTREFGIRMALGATLGQVIRAAALPGFIMAAVGVAIGFALAQPATSLLQGLLWGVTPADPLTFGAGAGGLLLVAMAASLIPAMRIIGLEPSSTLRHD